MLIELCRRAWPKFGALRPFNRTGSPQIKGPYTHSEKQCFWFWAFYAGHPQKGIAKQRKVKENGHGPGPTFVPNRPHICKSGAGRSQYFLGEGATANPAFLFERLPQC